MPIEERDYYNMFLTDGEQLYRDILSINENEFNSWVVTNFVEFNPVNTLLDVIPSKKEISMFVKKGYEHRASQCHYSAKMISSLDDSYEYFTGFIYRKINLRSFTTHSFNVKSNSIVDFARIDENLKKMFIIRSEFPHKYFGIRIPNDFVRKYVEDTLYHNPMRPLIFEWFEEMKFNKLVS